MKQPSFFFFIILIVSNLSIYQVSGLAIGPAIYEFDIEFNGTNTMIYSITSGGLSGQLAIDLENLPFRVEPTRINITKDGVDIPVELTFYGNDTLNLGTYKGYVIFLTFTNEFVAYAIKTKATINYINIEIQEEIYIEEVDNRNTYLIIGVIMAISTIVMVLMRKRNGS